MIHPIDALTIAIADLIHRFEAWAPPHWQESWDNCGWQVEPGVLPESAQVLVCLTPTLAVMEEAIARRERGISINLIFAHHPLIFSPLKSLCKGEAVSDVVRLGLQHGIGVYSAHTNFDQVADGTADVLAQIFQLQDANPIVPTQDGGGYGRVGQLPDAPSLETLLAQVQAQLSPPDVIYSPTADLQQPVARLAVLGGSGAGFMGAVAATGAQAYLTSDCKFHQFQEARDRGLVLIDAGHYATERPACARLVEIFHRWGADWTGLSEQDEDFRRFGKAP